MHLCNNCIHCAGFETEVISMLTASNRYLRDLEEQMQLLRGELREMRERLAGVAAASSRGSQIHPLPDAFPLSSYEDLLLFEQQLQDDSIKHRLVSLLNLPKLLSL